MQEAPEGEVPVAEAPAEEAVAAGGASEKKRLIAFLLCFFLGPLGVHRFYVGKTGTGVAMILTIGGFGIWALVDLVMILCGAFKDKEGLPITEWS